MLTQLRRRWRHVTATAIDAIATGDQAWLLIHTEGRPVRVAVARAELISLAQALTAPTDDDTTTEHRIGIDWAWRAGPDGDRLGQLFADLDAVLADLGVTCREVDPGSGPVEIVLSRTGDTAHAARERIQAALADLDHVRAGRATTHHDACWGEHIGCLAARLRRTLLPASDLSDDR